MTRSSGEGPPCSTVLERTRPALPSWRGPALPCHPGAGGPVEGPVDWEERWECLGTGHCL